MKDLNTDILILSFNQEDVIEKIEIKISKKKFPETARLAKIYQEKILEKLEMSTLKNEYLKNKDVYRWLVLDIFASFEDIFLNLLSNKLKSIFSFLKEEVEENESEKFLFEKTFKNFKEVTPKSLKKFLPWNKQKPNKNFTNNFNSVFQNEDLFCYSIFFDASKYQKFMKFEPWNSIEKLNISKINNLIDAFYKVRNDAAHTAIHLEENNKFQFKNTENENILVLLFVFVSFLYIFEKKFNLFFEDFSDFDKDISEENESKKFECFLIKESLLKTVTIPKTIHSKNNIINDFKFFVFDEESFTD